MTLSIAGSSALLPNDIKKMAALCPQAAMIDLTASRYWGHCSAAFIGKATGKTSLRGVMGAPVFCSDH
ncbi:hypothetical protein WJX74_008772 [Apatococcus lobatus]|uniref:Uncharacterized protein n=1 Tax=Apatococcus lobatus TaxID=904363 RepID=A0AAW1RWE4_9CHLO